MLAIDVARPDAIVDLERVVADGLSTFVNVGLALAAIRDAKLYEAKGYDRFDEYCRDQWDMGKAYANRLISGAQTAELVATIVADAPSNAAQVQPLTKLPPDRRPEAWAKAVDTAPDGKLTAKHVAQVVADMLPPKEPREPPIKDT